MPQQDPLKPGQVANLPQNTYDPNAEAGKVTSNLPYVAPPTAPNLLFDNTAPTTPNGASKVNPAYALYINTLKNNNAKQEYLSSPYYTKYEQTERYSDNELGGYHPFDMNLENWYGDNQSWFKQWGNRIGKTGTKALGSFANSLMDIPNAINAISEGSLDKMWDNPTNTWATDLMEWSEKNLPNYETNWEREHPFANLIPLYGFISGGSSANSWGKVFENLGFTIGAIGGAVAEDAIVGALTGGVGEIPLAAQQINKAVYNLGKFVNAGEDFLGALKANIKSADDIVKGLKGIDRFNYTVRQGLWGANMITSGMGEAAFEGIESYRTLSKDLQQQFLEENGRMPTYEDNQKIDGLARDAANSRFLLNSALLAVTNSVQWGSLMRPFNATKDLIEAEAKQGVRVALKEGSRDVFEAVDQSSKLAKWGKRITGNKVAQTLIGSSSEGFEEGAQYTIEKGVNDFYKRKYDEKNITTANNFLKSFSTGLSETLGTKEGWENIVYGLLGGAMYKGGEHVYYKARGVDTTPNYKQQVESVIKGLNDVSLSGIFENKYGPAVEAISIQEDLQQAASNGNLFEYKNYKHDHFVNFVMSGLRQNKFDTRIEQLNELKKLTGQEFEKTFGIPSNTENKRTVGEYVDKLVNNANYMKDIHKRVSRTFVNPYTYKGTGNYRNKEQAAEQNEENEKYLKYEEVKEELVRTMSISKDSADRVRAVRAQITETQSVVDADTVLKLSSQSGLADLRKEYKEKKKLAEEALKLSPNDAKYKKDDKWYGEKIKEIEDILNEKDDAAQKTKYNALLGDVFDRTQKENNTYYTLYGSASQQQAVDTPFPRDVIKDVISLGQDMYFLQKRNEVAIDRYARLTTKGGFKNLFDEIGKLRQQADALNVQLQNPQLQGQTAQQQAAFNAAQAQQGQTPTAQPQPTAPKPQGTGIPSQQGYTEDLGIQNDAEERNRLLNILVRAAEGKEKLEDFQLDILGFKTVDELKTEDPNVKLDDYTMVKSKTGKNFYIHKDTVKEARNVLNNVTSSNVVVPPVIPPVITSATTGNSGAFRTEDYINKVYVPADLKQVFNDAIFSGTKEQLHDKIAVLIRPISKEAQDAYNKQKTNKSYTPITGFPGVYSSLAPIDLSVNFHLGTGLGDTTIAKIGYPKRLLFKVGNDFVTIDKLTPQQYQQFTKKPAAQHAADVDLFNKQVAFTNYLALLFKNKGEPFQMYLNQKDTAELFNIDVTYGELDLIPSGGVRPLYTDLKHNKVTLPTKDKKGSVDTMVILSVPKRFIADKMVRERTDFNTPIFGQDFYNNPNADDTPVMDFINSSTQDILNVTSRYIGVVTTPDGNYRMVALRPARMTDVEANNTLASIKARSVESNKANFVESNKDDADGMLIIDGNETYYKLPNDEAKDFNKQYNEELNSELFISDNNGNVFFDLTISPIGALRLDIHEPISGYRNRIIISPQRVQKMLLMSDAVEALNEEIARKQKDDANLASLNIKLSADNLRKGIPDDNKIANAEELAARLDSATTTEVFKNGTLRINPNSDNVQAAYKREKGNNSNLTPEKTAQGETPVVTQTPSQVPNAPVTIPTSAITPAEWDVYYSTKNGVMGDGSRLADKFYNPVWAALDAIKNKIANVEFLAKFEQVKDSLKANGFTDDQLGLLALVPGNTAIQKLDNLSKRAEGMDNKDAELKELVDRILGLFNGRELAFFNSVTGMNFGPQQTAPNMFSGLSDTPVDVTGQPIATQQIPQNQEKLEDIVFPTTREALNAVDIDYNVEGDTVIFFQKSTGDVLDIPATTPLELAQSMKLKVAPQNKPKPDQGFDFMRSENEINTLNNLMNFENARNYIASILPSFIKVEELDAVMDKIREAGIENPEKNIWGAYSDGIIYLNRQAPEVGTQYHEAFHAVFSMLLPKEEQTKLLAKAKDELYKDLKAKGKSINSFVAEQRTKGTWTNIPLQEAVDKAAEEWMAESFRKWKNKKNNAGVFEKLFSLIERFFKWLLRSGNDIDALFNKIDTGGYKYSNIASNSFTQETTDENTTQEFKYMLIPARPTKMAVGKGTIEIKRNLDPKTSKQIVQNVSAYFEMYKKTGDFIKISDSKVLDRILDDLALTYNPNNAAYAGMSQEQLNIIASSDENYIYSNEETRDIIKDAAKKYINSMNYFEQFADEEQEEEEDTTGQPGTGYDNKSENVGGFSSLPGMLRHYIGFTSYEVKDRFGNKTLADKTLPDGTKIKGKPIIATVDAVSVYYGLLRATANITDPVRFFQRMILFADNNEQSRHFVDKFIKDSGLNTQVLFDENRLEANKNKALVEQVKKGFNKFRIDYVFTEYDNRKAKYTSYHANRKNVENVQFDKWSNNFIAGYAEMEPDLQANVRKSIDSIRNRYFDERRAVKRTEDETSAMINEVRATLNSVGMQFSYDFIRYSLLSINAKRYDDLNKEYKAQGAKLEFDDPRNIFISKSDYNYVQVMKIADEITLNKEFVDELSKALTSNENPYFRTIKEGDETDEKLKGGMVTRILNVAKGNALFDETVGESSFTNADGKVVFAHQDGTFNVKYSYSLRDAETRRNLRENGFREESTAYMDNYDSEWLTKNHLLNSASFEAVADNLLFQNIDGMRAVETTKSGKVITEEFRDQKDGVTYGSYSPREFFINNMNLYVSYAQKQKTAIGDVVTTPHLIRVLEASKTANTVNLPINVDVYRDGSVTAKTTNILLGEVEKEYNRIQATQNQIGTLTENIVENYHTGSFAEDGFTVTKGYRGLKFTDNMTSLLTKATANMLERKARTNQPLSEEDKNSVRQELKDSLNKIVDDSITLMIDEGVIKRGPKGSYQNVLLHQDFFKGNPDLNLQSVDRDVKFKTNIGHVIINDYINTLAYNQILHGDSALSLKNDGGIDAVKRAKGDNAAITSIRTDLIATDLGITKPFTHSSVAIFKEPFGADGTKIADAQMYTTIEGLRYTLWGLGRLSPRVARFLDALQNGENIHALKDADGNTYDGVFDEDNGLLSWDEMTNSLKLVFKDGKTYFKMSVVVLQPSLTATRNADGTWTTIPGWETLDNLRRKMEADGIHFAAPESASKMMTLDVSKAKDFSDLKGHLFDNQYFGLQTENPSNKLEITTPTQLLQLIDSEQNDNVEVYIGGEKTNVGAVRAGYQNAVAQKVTNAYDSAVNEIYDITEFGDDMDKLITDGKVTPRLAKFYERVSSTLESSGADAQLLDFFSLDENGNIKFNANLSAVKSKSQQLYLSYFSKGILSQKSPGYTVALFSGIDTKTPRIAKKIVNGVVTEWEYVRRDQWEANHNGVRNKPIMGSKDYVTEEGQLFLDELQHMTPQYNKQGEIIGYSSEMMLPAHFRELLGLKPGDEIPEAIAYMFGVRIPSQDKHSFISLKLIDFLPANLGSTGMFPKELVALSGADFDIDKLFITRYDFYMKNDGGKTTFHKYGDATTNEGKWEEYKTWMTTNSKPLKNTINDILSKNVDEKITKEEAKSRAVNQALKYLKLPSTLEEFIEASKTKELNNGVLNNKILDSYRALLTNTGMYEIANTPASLTALVELKDEKDTTLEDSKGNKIGSVFGKKTSYPVDSMIGKYYGFKNNTTGKNNIGIDVNANLIYSVANKGDISLSDPSEGFEMDDMKFSSFSGNREFNLETRQFDGKRTNDVLSTLITAATDEAKEQLNALYNLGVDALKVVNYLVALKVPLKTAIYFVNQPSIRNYLDIKSIKQNTIQTTEEDKLNPRIFKDEAMSRTNKQIKSYKDMSDDEMFSMFEISGMVEVVC